MHALLKRTEETLDRSDMGPIPRLCGQRRHPFTCWSRSRSDRRLQFSALNQKSNKKKSTLGARGGRRNNSSPTGKQNAVYTPKHVGVGRPGLLAELPRYHPWYSYILRAGEFDKPYIRELARCTYGPTPVVYSIQLGGEQMSDVWSSQQL